jgi:hypothetical protein
MHPFHSLDRTVPFRPTTALRVRKDGVPASPWMWAKARSKLGAVIRLCGDGRGDAECSDNGCVFLASKEIMHPFHSLDRTVPTHHRTPGAQRWCSRLAMDVGEGQKQTRCSDSPVRRRGDAECSDNGGDFSIGRIK